MEIKNGRPITTLSLVATDYSVRLWMLGRNYSHVSSSCKHAKCIPQKGSPMSDTSKLQ